MEGLKRWTAADSRELYNVGGWGQGYFDVNGAGHAVVRPSREGPGGIDLVELLEDAQGRGLSLPLLVRFSDILNERLSHLRQCFLEAIKATSYQGSYFGVYPVKVNQQRQVMEEVVRFGAPHGMGLEAGSRSELVAVLGMELGAGGLIVCNGYKDPDYVRLALTGQRLGKPIFLVVEKPGELGLILEIARQERVCPLLGIRLKLVSGGAGKWMESGGDFSKFGLTAPELVAAVERLRAEDQLGAFRLLHVHLGSQVPNIRLIKDALRELARYHAELSKLGCPIDYVDVGGGLGVDYDGSRTIHPSSMNYTEQEYANDVVAVLEESCRSEGLAHPHIITESGRALTAHHAMLAVNVFEAARMDADAPPVALDDGGPEVLARLERILDGLNNKTLHEYWHEALDLRDLVSKQFELGMLDLRHRARGEQLFWRIAGRVERLVRKERRLPEDFGALETLLADKYFCNFSVFQSLPDAWAIGQEFPVMPLHRLDERPTRRGILQDLTCDSDGRLVTYIGAYERMPTLPLHPLRPGQPYYLGVFLTGAYQEILGDLHNLFGDTNAVHVALNEDGSWRYEQIIRGEKVAHVLGYVQFAREVLADRIGRQVDDSLRAGRMTREQARAFERHYAASLDAYTYLSGPTSA